MTIKKNFTIVNNIKKTTRKGKFQKTMTITTNIPQHTRTVLEYNGYQLTHTSGYGYDIIVPKGCNIKLNVSGGYDPKLKKITYKVSTISTNTIISTIEDLEKMKNDIDNAFQVAQLFQNKLNKKL